LDAGEPSQFGLEHPWRRLCNYCGKPGDMHTPYICVH
jgi:hypothetical protein